MSLYRSSARAAGRPVRKPYLASWMAASLLLAIGLPSAMAQKNWDNGGDTINWLDAANWSSDTVPGTSVAETATINFNNAAVSLTGAAPNITGLTIANSSSMTLTSSVTIGTGGSLTGTSLTIGTNNAGGSTFGTLILNGGTLVTTGASNNIGTHTSASPAGGKGTLDVRAGSFTFMTGLNIGVNNIPGEMLQSGGSITNTYNQGGMNVGVTSGTLGTGNASGSYTLSDQGSINLVGMLLVGVSGRNTSAVNIGDAYGLVTQTGGDAQYGSTTTGGNVVKGLMIGASPATGGPYLGTATGVYKLLGGTLTASGIQVGTNANSSLTYSGSGTFEFGDANTTGTLLQRSGGARTIMVRTAANSDGTFIGWGDVGFTGALTNNGRIIADGYGTSRTLDFSTMTSVVNSIENGAAGEAVYKDISGWYAVNKGKLKYPGLTVSNTAGTYTVNLGEAPYGTGTNQDTDIDLVNSLSMTFTKDATADTQKIYASLIDPGHSDVLNLPSTHSLIGLWDITTTFALSNATAFDMVFRYDNTKAAALSLDENNLALYQYNSGTSTWEEVTTGVSINTTKKQLTATGLTSLSQYAIGYLEYVTAILGDLDNDSVVNNQDIAPFVLALTDLPSWQAAYPGVDILAVGDINGDAAFNNQDIAPFVTLLTGGGSSLSAGEVNAIPEPASLGLLAIGGLLLGLRGRRRRA